MAKFKKKENANTILIVIGIILVVLFLGKEQFMGAFITQCDNIEPDSITQYQDVIEELNGTMLSADSYTLQQETGPRTLFVYDSSSNLGEIEIIDLQDIVCSNFLQIVNQLDNNSQFIVVNQRQSLITSEGIIWCNYNNNIALRTQDIATISTYYDKFEVCITQEFNESEGLPTTVWVTDATECASLRGNITEGICTCSDGSKLEVGDICPDPEGDDTGGRAETGTTTSTTTSNEEETITQPPAPTEPEDRKSLIFTISGLALILFAAYWFLEKGPDKGLIKRKRKPTRRKKK